MARSPNVVLLNEHPAEQAFLRYFLSSKGIASSSLSHRAGLDALAALAPDLVILDDAAGGAEGAQRVKARFPNARVALVADTADRGGDAALRRPLDLSSLERDLLPLLGGPLGIEAPRKRVLVVDDDQDVLSLIRRILEASGCAVTCVPDPKDLLRHPPGDRYDLVLLDVRMPDVNGLEACYLLRQHYGDDLRICMITAATDPGSVKRAARCGADGWLTKPIRKDALLALIGVGKRSLEERGEPPGARATMTPLLARPVATTKRPHVLVVDDDRDVLEYCRAVLAGAGAVVDAIHDPSTFRDVLPPGGSYDLVLVDLFMPGMDGIEVLQRFSADVRNCASRLYVISACDDESLRALALRSGADGYLTKPLQRSSLLELLAS